MTEHENHHKIIIEETDGNMTLPKDSSSSSKFIIAGSVLLGALLISASLFYNTNILANKIEALQNLQVAQAPTTAGAQGSAGQPAPSAPTGPVNVAVRKSAPVEGNDNAKVTIVEFGDFQCPFCQSFVKNTLPQIKKQYIDTGKVKLVFRHFPLPFHVNAQVSAVAAECANQQGKFWQYHDLLYKDGQGDGTGLDKVSLEKYADSLGLNSGTFGFGKNKFNQCLENNSTLDIVKADMAEGTKDGVTGTPSFYINGQPIVGALPFANFQQAIDAALKK